jgi:DNA-binding MarR family transcriptional regulator
MTDSIEQLDDLIHQKIRLGIMTTLAAEDNVEFVELRERLGCTDGNLSSHIAILEKHRYLTVRKTFIGKKPKTRLTITRKGREAVQRYLSLLKRILQS